MAGKVLDGRQESDRLLHQLKRKISRLSSAPVLATIQVGRRPDASLYLKLKSQAAAAVGIDVERHQLPATISEKNIITLVKALNSDRRIRGILIQLPLPSRINTDRIIKTIAPQKDVDGFRPGSRVDPPTIAAIMHLLRLSKPKASSNIVILGQPTIFTKQLATYLVGHQVSIVRPQYLNSSIIKNADVIITVSGRGPMLNAKHVKKGVRIIDVGIRKKGNRVTGDVDSSVYAKAAAFSPVPGGVGPLTVAYVLWNVYSLTKKL